MNFYESTKHVIVCHILYSLSIAHCCSHLEIRWQAGRNNGSSVADELLVFFDGKAPSKNCDSLRPSAAKTVSKRRHRRSSRDQSPSLFSSAEEDAVVGSCRLHRWYLDFERLGWTRWVRIPTGYYANYCSGTCSVTPSGVVDNSTTMSNHAFVKSLYLAATNGTDVDEPQGEACCVSVRLSPISILYNNDDGQWVMTRMAEMTADECGCL